jgi:hypothetical protein
MTEKSYGASAVRSVLVDRCWRRPTGFHRPEHALGNEPEAAWRHRFSRNGLFLGSEHHRFSAGFRADLIAAFYQYDTRAHLQIDGRAATLAKRFAVSGHAIQARGSP